VTALEVRGLVKAYGSTQVLRGLDLAVEEGSLTAVLGPSGSGKTTLLRVVAGFVRADAGSVVLGGVVVDDGRRAVPAERRGVGYVPQEGALFPHLSVAANVGFGIRGARADRRADRRAKVADLLELVGLADLATRSPHELSGGQQQRVALARALAVDPAVVLLDEPFTALDPELRASVRAEVAAIIRRSGTTAVLVTHDQDEALSMADQVAVLRDGVVVQHGSPDALYRQPVDVGVARFLGAANLLPAVLDHTAGQAVAVTPLGPLAVRAGSGAPVTRAEVVALLRPEQLRLRPDDGAPPTGGVLRGVVVETEYYGHDAVVRVRTDAGAADGAGGAGDGPLTVRLQGDVPPSVGSRVLLTAHGEVTVWPAD
jgi:iron(III) transport system ATP-binding protein